MPEGPYPVPAGGPQRPVERAAARRADPRAGAEPDPRGDPALGRGLGRRGREPREDGLVTVNAEIWAETESQKGILIGKGGAKIGEIGTARPRARSSASSAPGSTSTSRSGCAATGAATRTCSTASASSSMATLARPVAIRSHNGCRRMLRAERCRCSTSAGLVPCVVQDFASGEVLTLAYVNEESCS